MEICSEKSISGVNRYLEMLLRIVSDRLRDYKIVWVILTHQSSKISLSSRAYGGAYQHLAIPIHLKDLRDINSLLQTYKYKQTLIHLLSDHLDWGAKTLVHIHTQPNAPSLIHQRENEGLQDCIPFTLYSVEDEHQQQWASIQSSLVRLWAWLQG